MELIKREVPESARKWPKRHTPWKGRIKTIPRASDMLSNTEPPGIPL